MPRNGSPDLSRSQNQPSRRQFVALAASAVALYACGSAEADGAETAREGALSDGASSGPDWLTLYVGTYTKSGASRGIYQTTVHARTLAFGALSVAAPCAEPSFLALSPNRQTLVAVSELLTYAGEAAGSVRAFTRASGSGALEPVGSAPSTRGAAPCYVTIDRTGAHVLVANYVGGNVTVHPLMADGSVGPAWQVVAHSGTGPHPVRQKAPHAHCIVLDAQNRFAVSADLGADRLFVYRFDAAAGSLTPADVPSVALAPGAGPRHVAFAPDGRTLYCANELDSTLSVFAWDGETGTLTHRQTLSARPAGATGDNAPADLHVHPSGRTVYLSNRGDNTMAVFAVDATAGSLTLVQTVSSGGNWPRNFTLTPDGTGLLVAHQRSDSIVPFHIDATSGHLSPAGPALTAPVPVCLLFA
ncbi:lactonase family protein [Gemmatimonas sp.]